MMRNIKELNIQDNSPPVSISQIREVEAHIGNKLPSAYVDFVLLINGGAPELNTFFIEEDGQKYDWGINNFFYFGNDVEITESVVWNYQHKWGAPDNYFPFARDGGDNLFCFDLSKGEDAPVVMLYHPDGTDEPEPLADNFVEFINGLKSCPDDF
jgi:hypothetical protein